MKPGAFEQAVSAIGRPPRVGIDSVDRMRGSLTLLGCVDVALLLGLSDPVHVMEHIRGALSPARVSEALSRIETLRRTLPRSRATTDQLRWPAHATLARRLARPPGSK
jgi:hypothetical protein